MDGAAQPSLFGLTTVESEEAYREPFAVATSRIQGQETSAALTPTKPITSRLRAAARTIRALTSLKNTTSETQSVDDKGQTRALAQTGAETYRVTPEHRQTTNTPDHPKVVTDPPHAPPVRDVKIYGKPRNNAKNNAAAQPPEKPCPRKLVRRRNPVPSPRKEKGPPPLPVLSREECRHLTRVFDHMAGLTRRLKLSRNLDQCLDRMLRLQEFLKHGASLDPSVGYLKPSDAQSEILSLEAECARLKVQLIRLKHDPRKTISVTDLEETIGLLGHHMPRAQLQYILWEADDNQDGVIDRSEFDQTFLRNMADLTNKEPRELYNIIQFLTLDESMKGRITEDETIGILFARYGNDRIEAIIASLFGERLKTLGGPGVLSFSEYLERVGVRYQPEALKHLKSPRQLA